MPRQAHGIGRVLTVAANLLSSGLTISILWVVTVGAAVGGIFETIQAWDEPWRTLFWVFFGLLIFAVSTRIGLAAAARLKRPPVVLGVGTAEEPDATPAAEASDEQRVEEAATSQELLELSNALRALSEDLINLFFDFQPTPAMSVPAEKEPELEERYRRDFADRVVHHYGEAKRRGFADSEIERCYQSPDAFRSLARLAWRFGELAERVLNRAKA